MRGQKMSLKHKIKARNGENKMINLTPLVAIHLHCIECMAFAVRAVKSCENSLCPLHPYKDGTNPCRKGIGGIRRQKPNLRRHLRKV
jgi:hypothetical protein